MLRTFVRTAALAALAVALPAAVSAQMQSWKEVQVADIETMKEKFIGLAQEFDESQYDWRPMEGVRSVRDVLALAVVEAHIFPTFWGYEPPAGVGNGFGPENQRVAGFSKAQLLRELDSAFDHLIGVVRGMDETKRNEASTYFGRQMPVHANVATAMADLHEHLGQLIAYARTNRVVPPWSR
ncbi:MAG: DinB family protein [Gemmatimonadales bacterium]